MTSFAPSPRNPHVPTPAHVRTRVRWDNIAVLCAALAVAGGIATTVMSQAGTPAATPQKPAPAVTSMADASSTAQAATGNAVDGVTLTEAASLVEEARDFISQGRWDEAADRLAGVDESMRAATGADAAVRELDLARSTWNRLDQTLREQVGAERWKEAQATLDQLAEVAPLGADQLAMQDEIAAALTPAASVKKPAAATTSRARSESADAGGSGAGTATQNTTPRQPKPAPTRSPAAPAAAPATGTAQPRPKPAPGSTTVTAGGVTITVPSTSGSSAADAAAQLEQLLGAAAVA